MAELVDALDLGSSVARRGSSSLPARTIISYTHLLRVPSMRIISRFHDYYDTVQGLGYDSELCYVRNPKVLSTTNGYRQHSAPWAQLIHRLNPPDGVSPIVVVVGDTVYHGLDVHVMGIPAGRIWSEDALTRWASANIKANHRKDWLARFSKTAYLWDSDSRYTVLEWLRLDKQPTPPSVSDAMRVARAPVVVAAYRNAEFVIEANASLREVEFYRRLDPQAAFQEISMWVGSNLTSSSAPPIAISDEVRIAQHGFTRCSFRRCKS